MSSSRSLVQATLAFITATNRINRIEPLTGATFSYSYIVGTWRRKENMLNEAFRYVESIVAYFISPPLYRVANSLYTLLESIQACAVTATSIFNLATT
jgi:hypothetical protein